MSNIVKQPKTLENSEKSWAMLCHLSAFAGLFIPFGHIFGPLIIWLIQKEDSAYVDTHGKEALNFQLTMTLYSLISAVLCCILIGFVLLLFFFILNFVMVIIASVKGYNGTYVTYPMNIRFIA